MRGLSARPHVVVIGGGIGGLTTAAFLAKVGLPFHVYERASEIREVGAGIVVAPNAMRLLTSLGLSAGVRAAGVRMEISWEFRRWSDGRVLSSEAMGDAFEKRYGQPAWMMHRADLLDLLKSAVPGQALSVNAEAAAVEIADDKVTVQFKDGALTDADCVIAADGVHSTLRRYVTDPQPPTYSGLCAWRALVPSDRVSEFARRPAQTLWLGPGRHVVHYPVARGRFVNIVAATPAFDDTPDSWSSEGSPSQLVSEFEGWDPRLMHLLGAVERTGRWALVDRDPIDRWTCGRLALLGDAAHPMTPLFAQGASQAMEDAVTIAHALAQTPNDVVGAMARYEHLRAPRANAVLNASRGRQRQHHLPDGEEQRARDAAFATADPLVSTAWIYDHDAELQAMRAACESRS